MNGESAENFAEYAYFLSNRGRTNEAVRQMTLALRKDSRSYRTLQGAAFVFQAARQPDDVINKIQVVIERESSPSGKAGLITRFLVPAYLAKGDYLMAIKLEEDSELSRGKKPDQVKAKYDTLRKVFAEDKEKGYWQQQLQFELSENSENRPVRLAAIYARLGDTERAIDYLRQTLVRTPTELVFDMNRDPSFDNLRSDPGFKEVLKKLERGK